jgi:hypothetical protein
MKYAIRRNLRKNAQFGWMQIHELDSKSSIKKGSKDVFIDPTKQSIEMYDCYLHNSVARAIKIHSGEIYKERCSWISCESYEIADKTSPISDDEITYNPRVSPNWMQGSNNVDKQTFDCLVTDGTRIYNL